MQGLTRSLTSMVGASLHACIEDHTSPTLEDYKTGNTKACSISEVLRHPYVERLSTMIVVQGPLCPSSLVISEPESGEVEPDNNDISDLQQSP